MAGPAPLIWVDMGPLVPTTLSTSHQGRLPMLRRKGSWRVKFQRMSNSASPNEHKKPPSSHLLDHVCRLLRETSSLFAPMLSFETALLCRSDRRLRPKTSPFKEKTFPLCYFCVESPLLNHLIHIYLSSEAQKCAEGWLSQSLYISSYWSFSVKCLEDSVCNSG